MVDFVQGLRPIIHLKWVFSMSNPIAFRIVRVVGSLAIAGNLIFGLPAYAQTPDTKPAINGTFFVAPAKMADEEVKAFLGSPDSLLEEFLTGGLPLSTRVRSLAGSSPETLDPIVALVPKANTQQMVAIGAGLARAARALATINPEYAALIQEKIATLNNPGLNVAFASALGEIQTAALGGGGAGAGAGAGAAGIGGGGVAGGGSAGTNGDEAIATSAETFNGRSSTQSFFASDNAGNSTSDSVSPN